MRWKVTMMYLAGDPRTEMFDSELTLIAFLVAELDTLTLECVIIERVGG